MRIFLAGAAGAIGRRLVPLLRGAGATIVGTTRAPEKAAMLRNAGVEPVIVDMFDAAAVHRAVGEARPDFLIHPAKAAGVRRAVVQSIGFVYSGGTPPHPESDPVIAPGVVELETAALSTRGVEGVVLRYGRLWGPGTWAGTPAGLAAPLHVDAAAHAALLALTRGTPGIYNIAESDGALDTSKAVQQLGFDSSFRLPA